MSPLILSTLHRISSPAFPPHLPSTVDRQVIHFFNLSPLPEPTSGSPELRVLPFPLHSSNRWRAARKRHFVDHPIRKQYPDGLHVPLCPPAKRLLHYLWIREPHSAARGENNDRGEDVIHSIWCNYFGINCRHNAHHLISSQIKVGAFLEVVLVEFVTVCLSVLLLLIECLQLCSNPYLVWHELNLIVLI